MLQITFLALGLSGLLFAVAYFFKKYQRGILWVAALILFIGTSLMLGLGLIKVVENGVANHLAVFSVILSFLLVLAYLLVEQKRSMRHH